MERRSSLGREVGCALSLGYIGPRRLYLTELASLLLAQHSFKTREEPENECLSCTSEGRRAESQQVSEVSVGSEERRESHSGTGALLLPSDSWLITTHLLKYDVGSILKLIS